MEFCESSLRLEDFGELGLAPEILGALAKIGVTQPNEVQRQSIPVAISGADMIVVAQTGSGKTLAFALAILAGFAKNTQSRALILVPSREMALQIQSVLKPLTSESICLVIGGLPGNKQRKELNKLPRLIVATPGRLNDLLSHNKLLLQRVDRVVLDEADRMLDLGFAPQLEQIQKTMRGSRQTLLFSATLGPHVDAISKIFMPGPVVKVRVDKAEEPVENLEQRVIFLASGEKNARLIEELKATTGGVLLFAGSQDSCETVEAHLNENGFTTNYVHGGLTQAHRSRIVQSFRDGAIRILVATDLLARGLDIAYVETVINFDLPFSPADFLHRIGRTARAGRAGRAITFISPRDHSTYRKIKPYLKGATEEGPRPLSKRAASQN